MQRALVILAVFVLVTVALAVGALASNWPFWARAWQWQRAADGWPQQLPGPTRILHGGAALPLQFDADPALAAAAAGTTTAILLRADADGRGSAFLAPGYATTSLVDGRGLAAALLPPLYGLLAVRQPDVLDQPLSTHVERWRGRPRGEITPRQLLWQLSGLPAGDFHPLNPASARAQLASGPDFTRAALHWKQIWPAGSHFEEAPVNAQLLAVFAARTSGIPYAQLLQHELWSQMAADDAVATLDHPRGSIAAHCCLRATAADWLRVGLLLADDGRVGARQLLPSGLAGQLAQESPVHPGHGLGFRLGRDKTGHVLLVLDTPGRQLLVAPAQRRALLWIGTGPAPLHLHQLLDAATASADDSVIAK